MFGMNKIIKFLLLSFLVMALSAFSIRGNGENKATVQSSFYGTYYVRTIPDEDYGNRGVTKVYRVKKNQDELLDEYPIFMRGEIFLGWSPIEGKWCLVHIEPERITSNNDYEKIGKTESLNLYMGGKLLKSYSRYQLQNMGLMRRVSHLEYMRRGDFLVEGIKQIPRTNTYAFKISVVVAANGPNEVQEVLLDVTTGEILDAE